MAKAWDVGMRITLSMGRYRVVGEVASSELPGLAEHRGLIEGHLGWRTGPEGIEHHVLQWPLPELVDGPGGEDLSRLYFEEARRAAHLRHPNLATAVEIVEGPALEYVATEYVHGEDLARVIAHVRRTGEQVPAAMLVGIGSAVAAGLHHAHAVIGPQGIPLGVVHGALSPASIRVGYDGSVKITGFGLAATALAAGAARGGALGRMASYLSPEVVTGRPADGRSDVFALGAVLYELATGRPLFRGPSEFLTMSAIAHGDVPRPSRHRPDLPRPLEAVILKALETSPDDRYQSADELRAALAAYARSVGMRSSTASIADYLRKLFGDLPPPWLLTDRQEQERTAAIAAEHELDGRLSGAAAPPAAARDELALPASARRSTTAPIVLARRALLGRATAAAPGHPDDWGAPAEPARTPMSWASQSVAEPSRRRLGLAIAGALAAAAASFFTVGQLVRPGEGGPGRGDGALSPMAAPLPPPPPPPPPPVVTPLPPVVTPLPPEEPATTTAAPATPALAKPALAKPPLAKPAPPLAKPAPPLAKPAPAKPPLAKPALAKPAPAKPRR